jgi:hypothetical protein
MNTNESQWDDEDYQSKMYSKYAPEIEEARERDKKYRAERDSDGKSK